MSIRLGRGLWLYWVLRGLVTEGREWLKCILAGHAGQLASHDPDFASATGTIACLQSDYDEGATYLSAALESA